MKHFRSANPSPLNSIVTLAAAVFLFTACGIFSPGGGGGGGDTSGTGWKVWVKTSPCAGGRTDWISVAKTNPTEGGGGSFWQTADLIQSPAPCTRDVDDCTFAAATAAADTIRPSSRFTSYCCRDYSVWRNMSTRAMSVVAGKNSTGGFGWMLEKANLCCEEAEALAGIPGACSGSQAPPLGPIVRSTPRVTNTNTTIVGNDGGTNSNGEVVTKPPFVMPTQPPPPPPVSGRWILVSTTVAPDPPAQGGGNKWSYNAQSSSARYEIYNGDAHDFQWTKPPQQIDANGFTITLNVQCQSQNLCASLLGVGGSGIESDTPRGEWLAAANGKNGAPGSGQKSVTFKPSPNANELEVEIGMMWGAVRFVYKYQRAQ